MTDRALYRRALSAKLVPIYGITFIDILGFTLLIPLMPGLAQKFDISPGVTEALLSATALSATLTAPLWGAASDRVSRKLVIQVSQFCTLVAYALFALAGSVTTLFTARLIQGIGGGNLGVVQSYIADVTEDDVRETAYAWNAAAFGLGFIVGPIIGGLLLKLGLTVPFWFASGLAFVNFILTGAFVAKTRGSSRRQAHFHEVVDAFKHWAVANLLGRQFLYIFSYVYFFTVFSLYLDRVLHVDPTTSSLYLALAGVVGVVVQLGLVGRLTRRFGDGRVSQAAFMLSFAAYAVLGFVHGTGEFVLVLAAWAVGGAVQWPLLNAMFAKVADARERGALFGVVDSLNSAAMLAGPAIAGTILGRSAGWIGIVPGIAIASAFTLGTAAPRALSID